MVQAVWKSTDGGVRYSSRGEGAPVVLLHGWCLGAAMWTYAEEHLRHSRRILVPELPGFGQSTGVAGPYTLARYASGVARILAEEELEDVTLVGFAFGAAVSLAVAALEAVRTRQVISVGMPDPSATPYAKMPRSMRRDWPDFARRSANALLLNTPSAATLEWLERLFASAPLSVAIETCEVLQALDAPSLARAAPVSQLYIHSTTDPVAPVAYGQACVAAAANARLAVIEGSGHLIVLDAKEELHTLLEQELAVEGTP